MRELALLGSIWRFLPFWPDCENFVLPVPLPEPKRRGPAVASVLLDALLVVSISACHVEDPGLIPGGGVLAMCE